MLTHPLTRAGVWRALRPLDARFGKVGQHGLYSGGLLSESLLNALHQARETPPVRDVAINSMPRRERRLAIQHLSQHVKFGRRRIAQHVPEKATLQGPAHRI